MLIKPERLQRGDAVGLIAPASAPPEPETVDACIRALEQLGFNPLPSRHARRRLGYLAGSDRDRAADLMRMFADPKVKAIFCVRGGYGTARLLNRLDYSVVRKHPKIFVGYSDVTSLHCAFLKHARLVSFHGPMVASDLAKDDCPDFTIQSLLHTLTMPDASINIAHGYRKQTVTILRRGIVAGRLVGGNLSVLCTTLGTRHEPSFRNRILFLEDIDEPPYRFDRMLTHLLNAGRLQQVAGVAVGLCANCEDPKAKRRKEYRQTLDDVLRDRLLPLRVPVVTGLPFGHVANNATIPIGVRATLEADRGELLIAESAVR